jgi:tetratricopeptide (TPR) repeat protein
MNQKLNKYGIFFICLILTLSTLAVFWQMRHHEFINFDDNQYIVNNSEVKAGLTLESFLWSFTSICAHNWHPLTWLSHMLDYDIYGLNPGGHHFTNMLFHIANALLLFWVLRRMTGRLWPSAFVAAAFALHPLHVESVAWASERKDVLSTFFLLLTMWAYVCYVERPRVKRYLLILLLFTHGLMAKQMLVTLPFVLLLLDYWPLRRLRFKGQNLFNSARGIAPASAGRCILEKLPLFILSAAASVVVFLVQQRTVVKTITEYPLIYRIENALVSYVVYIFKMFWPSHLAIFYPHPLGTLVTWKIAGSALLLVCITIVVIWKARQYPYLAVGWLWYLITLLPVIGLIQIGLQAFADRYTYMSLTGLFIIIVWGISDLFARLRYRVVILSLTSVILFLVLCVSTWCQVRHWRNNITLYKHATTVIKNNWWAYFRLGMAFDQQNNLDEAMKHYTKALQIKPGFPAPHKNLGYVLARQGKLDEAIKHYTDALRYRPDFADAHTKLGNALLRQGKFDEAIEHFSEAIRIEPDVADTHSGLGYALAQKGRFDEAIEHYTKAIQLKPYWPEALENLNKLLLKKRRDEIVARYVETVKENPDDADTHDKLAKVYYQEGKIDNAIKHWRESVRIKPDWPEAHNNLATAFYQQGKLSQAIKHWTEAVALKPDWAEVCNNLAWVLAANNDAKLHNPEEAVRLAKKACELTDYQQPVMLDTLGVAYAAAGRFQEAVAVAEKAINIAKTTDKNNLAEQIQERLQLYKACRPYREK